MSVQRFAEELKAAILEGKGRGATSIPCDGLIAYLDEVLKSGTGEEQEFELERLRASLQADIESHKAMNQAHLEMFRSVITTGQTAIRSSLILNGGSAVALLAFIGHLATDKTDKVTLFAPCLFIFGLGALAIVITSGFTYLSQWLGSSTVARVRTASVVINYIAIGLGIASYFAFLYGLFETFNAFTGLG